MGIKTSKRITARRAASFLAVLGVLVLSSGVALMASAGSANAVPKDDKMVTFCHSTSSETNAWVEETTSVNAFYQGHVLAQHTSDIYPAVSFEKQGQTINVAAQGDQAVLANHCKAVEQQPTSTTANVTFTDPTCANNNTASYSTSGTGVNFDSPTAAPGATITVHATAANGYVLTGNTSFTHTFSAAANCSSVSTPTSTSVSPPKHHVTKAKTKAAVTPTVVEAGLSGATVQDMRAEQGLALMAAGMVMLVAAGGLGLRLRGGASRI